MMIEQNYNLDLVPSGTPLVVYVSQFDKGGRRLSFTLYKDNVAFTLPTGASATILGTKPDQIAFMYAMQTSGDKIYIDVTEQMTAVAGPVQCEIRVSNTSGEQIGSSNFIIYCEKTPLDSDAVISETDIPVFEELVAQANTAAAEANTASAQAQQYAQQAQESAESIDVSALEAQIASKAPSVSPTLKFAVMDSADGNTNPHAEFRTMGNSPSKSVGFAVYDENGNGTYYDLIKGDGTRYFATVPEVNAKAPLASPALTGTPTAPTAPAGTNTTQIATTAYVKNNLGSYAPLASPALTGNPTATTQAAGNNSTRIATTEFVTTAISNLVSDVLGGWKIYAPSDFATSQTLVQICQSMENNSMFIVGTNSSSDFGGMPAGSGLLRITKYTIARCALEFDRIAASLTTNEKYFAHYISNSSKVSAWSKVATE